VSQPETIAITGLRTFVGQRLAQRLVQSRPELRVIGIDVRRPYRLEGLEGRVRFHRVDLSDPTADGRLADVLTRERVDAVVHTAFRDEPTPDLEADHELETIGSLHVMNACAAAKVPKLVVASSTMLYGPWPDNPNFLTEAHELRGHPDAHCVRNRIEVESLLRGFERRHPDTAVTVLRSCWVMGPNVYDAVVRYFARPVVPLVLGYDPLLQFVHEDDLVYAFECAVLGAHAGVYNVVGRGVLPVSTLLRQAGRRIVPVPATLLYRLGAYPSQAQTGDRPAGFYDYLRYLWVADGARGWEAFGEPVYSTQEAWAAFVSARRMRRYR
jgi:UDP-glucose 4-epimerase